MRMHLLFVVWMSLLCWGCGQTVDEPVDSQEKPPNEQTSLPDLDQRDNPNDSGTVDQSSSEPVPEESKPPPERDPIPEPPPEPPPPHQNRTAYTVPQKDWNETAVRKVLHIFAFGGFATDAQIKTWASMKPEEAINEILSFHPHHPKL